MDNRSSLYEDFLRVKTHMGLERFEVEKSLFWSWCIYAENQAISSLQVGSHHCASNLYKSKFLLGSEQFEVGKFRNSYDVPFRSCLGKSVQTCKLKSPKPKSVLLGPAAAEWESCFDLAKNCGSSSLWVGDHRYVGVLCASKFLWV